MPRPDEPSPWRLAHIGLELGGSVGAMALLGYWADRQFATGPWGVVAGTCLGFVGGMYLFIKRATQATARYTKTPSKDGDAKASRNDSQDHDER
ncbi:MAG: AtpZ/AtpI family protein [Phycisphaeraceae bacterium]